MNDRKILVVEDDAFTALWIVTILKEMGFTRCEHVNTAETAIEKAINFNPDFIFMDIWLADEMNGFDAARKILSYIKTSIIFISGYSENQLLEQIENINYTAFLNKPLRVEEIQKILSAD